MKIRGLENNTIDEFKKAIKYKQRDGIGFARAVCNSPIDNPEVHISLINENDIRENVKNPSHMHEVYVSYPVTGEVDDWEEILNDHYFTDADEAIDLFFKKIQQVEDLFEIQLEVWV